jgi:acetyl esterase/lipase
MWTYYLGPDRKDAPLYAAPGLTPELSGLPPTYLLVCEFDPLRDEGLDYGRRLVDSYVPTEIHHWPGTLHAFDQVALASGLPLGQRVIGEQIEALARGLAAV